jgi:hypothetical protein
MPKLQLTLENLAELKGGIVERMLANALNRIAMDLRSAPDIPDWRRVTLEIRAKPTIEDGELSDVIVEFSVYPKCPARVTSARMEVASATNGAKQLFFAIDAPDNPAQKTISDIPGVME